MTRVRSALAAPALLALAGCSGSAHGPAAPAPSIPAIDALAEAALRHGGAVGISIVVMRGDKVVHARGYGLEDVEHQVPATERSVYLLASLSKQFWAVGIGQLVEQNRISVEAPVADLLPGFPDRRVTLEHLLTQTSGLGEDDDNEDDVHFTDVPPVAFDPGTWWSYSNRGAILVRRVIEQVTNAPWRQYLDEHIAKPLGLASMTTCDADHQPPMYDAKRVRVRETVKKVGVIQFVCANALDVAQFERSLDVGGLLRPATVAAMRAPTEIAELSLPYGWLTRIANLDGHRAYGHTGNGDGVNVAAFRFPDDDLTIVVLINAAPAPPYTAPGLVARIARAELHLPEPALHDHPVSAADLAPLVGSYVNGPNRADVSARDGHAYLVFSHAGTQVWEGALVATEDPRAFAGGPGGEPDPDYLAQFWPPTGAATAIAVGHRFLLDALFRRE